MKKLIGILVLGLVWCNLGFSKIINIENKIILDVSNTQKFIKITDKSTLIELYGGQDQFEIFEPYEPEFFIVGQSQIINFVKSFSDGEDLSQTKLFGPILRKAEKKKFRDEKHQLKWAVGEIKKTLKKEKVDFWTYVLIGNKKVSEIDDDDEFKKIITEHQNMTNSELSQKTKEYRKLATTLAGDNKTILINDDMSFKINKFQIAKNEYNELFLNANGIVNWINIAKLQYNIFITKKNDRLFLILSECWINCPKQNSKFQKMIKPTFSEKKSVTKTVSTQEISTGIVDQLKQLEQLYDEGALTKEEFEKAKKKVLSQ